MYLHDALGCGGSCACAKCQGAAPRLGERYIPDDDDDEPSPPARPPVAPRAMPVPANPDLSGYGKAPPPCATRFTRARTFRELIALVRAAETQLAGCGFTSPEARLHVLRGIYYGTEWSGDFLKERSAVRNAGFQIYTGSRTPADPRPCLACGLFEALHASQDLIDGPRAADFGHLIIGMDARRSALARTAPLPTKGGTGLELCTWLGDLGGGAPMLATRRATAPATPAISVFRGTDFGGSINLEGDLAGFLVAQDPASGERPSAPIFPGASIAAALETYLGPAGPTPAWRDRARRFLAMNGAAFNPAGNLINRAAVLARFADRIQAFACWYLVNRLRQQNRLTLPLLMDAASHLAGAALEVATVFTDALEQTRRDPRLPVAARGPSPAPTPRGASTGLCRAAIEVGTAAERAAGEARRLYERGRILLPF